MGFWKKEFTQAEIDFVLGKIKETRIVDVNGKVSFRGFFSEQWTPVLLSAVGFDVRTDALKRHIINMTLWSDHLSEDFSKQDFVALAYRLRNKFQKIELTEFKVVFPICNKPNFLSGIKKIDDVTLNFTPSEDTKLFKVISEERKKQRHENNEFFQKHFFEISNCSTCIAHVRANNYEDASERACQALYEMLGLINLVKDLGKSLRISFGGSLNFVPVSEVLIAPHITSHFKNGKLTHTGFWAEYWNREPRRIQMNSNQMENWRKGFQMIEQALSKSKWKTHCKLAAAKYFKAFSDPNLDRSFFNGWKLFENIAGTAREEIQTKIERASNIFEDQMHFKLLGKHLALRRNLITHAEQIQLGDNEIIAFQMREFTACFLEFFIMNHYSLKSVDELWALLDLTRSKPELLRRRSVLSRRLALIDAAEKYHGIR